MSDNLPAPRFSIIVPAYNARKYIGSTISSVLAQTSRDWELIVIDDGSTDGTSEEIERFTDGRIRRFRHENIGPAPTRWRGVAEARADYIVFLDSDDKLRPDTLRRLGAALDNHLEACVSYGDEIFMTEDGKIIGSEMPAHTFQRPSGHVLEALLKRNFIFLGAVCVRANALRALDRTYTGYINEDWPMWCQLATRGEFVHVGSTPLLEYRMRKDSLTRTHAGDLHASLRSVDFVFSDPVIVDLVPSARLRELRSKRESIAYAFAAKYNLTPRRWPRAFLYAMISILKDLRHPSSLVLPSVLGQHRQRRSRASSEDAPSGND